MIRVLELNRAVENARVVEYQDAQAALFAQRPDSHILRWVDITEQTSEDIELIRKGFQFHPLTLEDCLHFDQRPKLEEFPGNHPYVFIVIHNFKICMTGDTTHSDEALTLPQSSHSSTKEKSLLRMQEVHAYLGPNYLVTVHRHPIAEIDGLFQRLRSDTGLFQRGCDFLYYLLADQLCDSNFPVLEHLSDELDQIEELVIASPEKRVLTLIYDTRKVLVRMRRTLSPQRDLMALLARHGGGTYIQPSTAPYFRDVYDHLVRINEAIESGRDLLGNCVDAYMSSVGQRTNDIVKQLTILSSVMLPLTFVVGFFGMNFDALPFHSLGWFVFVLLVMILILPTGMVYWFHRKRWI